MGNDRQMRPRPTANGCLQLQLRSPTDRRAAPIRIDSVSR